MLKQPQFNWEVADKYSEWKAFILEVKNILTTYNAQEHEQNGHTEKWVRQTGVALCRKYN